MTIKPITSLRLSAPIRLGTLALIGALLLGSGLQAQQREEALVKADIAFARGLAARFQYVDLAEEILLELDAEKKSKGLTEELGLAKCDVFYEGARREGDQAKRLVLYDKAMSSYEEFIDGNPFSEFLGQAQRSYVDLCNAYSSIMERAASSMLGEEAEALHARIRGVLEKGLERTGELLGDLVDAELSPQEKLSKWRLMLNRGQMLITFAKASDEGTFLFGQADKTLESLALEAGETSGWGMNAYLLLAKSKIAQGDYYDATAFAEYVINHMVPRSEEDRDDLGWGEISPDYKAKRWELAERGTVDLLSAFSALGDTDSACVWALHFYNSWKRDGFALAPIGYLSLLEVGRVLLASGGYVGGSIAAGELEWFETAEAMTEAGFSGRRNSRSAVDLALSIAQEVNDENKGTILQVYAQKLISEIRDLPGVVLAPEVLFEAAQGEYHAKNYREAYGALKGVLRALDAQDEATRRTFAPQVLFYMGRSLEKMHRPLEAALTFKEAVTTWKGDLEYDPKNARGYYECIGDVRTAATGDKLINQMWLEAEQIVVEVASKNTDDIVWRQAERLYGQKDWEGAREKYLEVGPKENSHEQAIVKAALCFYKMKDTASAEAEFRHYLEDFVTDPRNVVNAAGKKLARSMARAQATFYVGRIAYQKRNYEEVVKTFGGYETAFPDQTSYAPNALYMLLMSHLGLKQFEEGKATHAIMREKFPTHKTTGTGALQIYTLTKSEYEIAVAANDSENALSLRRQMAEFIRISNSLTSKPSFQNLRTETSPWIELEEWEKGEAAARQTLSFASDPARAADMDKRVLPDLAHCLLMQRRVPEAFEVLDPLVPDPEPAKGEPADTRRVAGSVTANWCRAASGWLEGDAQNIVEVPGVGGAENFAKAGKLWVKLAGGETAKEKKWECDWYDYKFQLFYSYYRWGQIDSAQLATCKKLLTNFREAVNDPSMKAVADTCGNDLLQRRYLWLWDKVR
jgi:tetratricopeptide (TPR) repeat protein